MALRADLSQLFHAQPGRKKKKRGAKRPHSKKGTSPKADEARETKYVFGRR